MREPPIIPIRIPIHPADKLKHFAPYYQCNDDPSCPCRAYDTQVMPGLWTGALLSIERDQARRRTTARLGDQTPTDILPPLPLEMQETFRLAVHGVWRKHTPWWRRLLRRRH